MEYQYDYCRNPACRRTLKASESRRSGICGVCACGLGPDLPADECPMCVGLRGYYTIKANELEDLCSEHTEMMSRTRLNEKGNI